MLQFLKISNHSAWYEAYAILYKDRKTRLQEIGDINLDV